MAPEQVSDPLPIPHHMRNNNAEMNGGGGLIVVTDVAPRQAVPRQAGGPPSEGSTNRMVG